MTYGLATPEGTLYRVVALPPVVIVPEALSKLEGFTAPDAVINASRYVKFALISEARIVPPELNM